MEKVIHKEEKEKLKHLKQFEDNRINSCTINVRRKRKLASMRNVLKKFRDRDLQSIRNSGINRGIRNDGTQSRDSQSGSNRSSDSGTPTHLFAIFSL